ncbi:4Fe-4S binding protein [bacterium]|nr:4Fe-4S binding protein [bacterium]
MNQPVVEIDVERCDFCGICVSVCPSDAIELRESIIRIDRKRCTICRFCVDICPLGIPEVRE